MDTLPNETVEEWTLRMSRHVPDEDWEERSLMYRMKYAETYSYKDCDNYTCWTDPDWGEDCETVSGYTVEDLYEAAGKVHTAWKLRIDKKLSEQSKYDRSTESDYKLNFGDIYIHIEPFSEERLHASKSYRAGDSQRREAITAKHRAAEQATASKAEETKKAKVAYEKQLLAELLAKHGNPTTPS